MLKKSEIIERLEKILQDADSTSYMWYYDEKNVADRLEWLLDDIKGVSPIVCECGKRLTREIPYCWKCRFGVDED